MTQVLVWDSSSLWYSVSNAKAPSTMTFGWSCTFSKYNLFLAFHRAQVVIAQSSMSLWSSLSCNILNSKKKCSNLIWTFLQSAPHNSPCIPSKRAFPQHMTDCFGLLLTEFTLSVHSYLPSLQILSGGQYVWACSPQKIADFWGYLKSPNMLPNLFITLAVRALSLLLLCKPQHHLIRRLNREVMWLIHLPDHFIFLFHPCEWYRQNFLASNFLK